MIIQYVLCYWEMLNWLLSLLIWCSVCWLLLIVSLWVWSKQCTQHIKHTEWYVSFSLRAYNCTCDHVFYSDLILSGLPQTCDSYTHTRGVAMKFDPSPLFTHCLLTFTPWPLTSYNCCYERALAYIICTGSVHCMTWCSTGSLCLFADICIACLHCVTNP